MSWPLPVRLAWLGCVAALATGCGKVGRAPAESGAAARQAIAQYLTKKSGDKSFAPEAALAASTNATRDLGDQADVYIRSVRQQISTVPNYEALYRLVGQQLATAGQLLAQTNLGHRRLGLKLAREACSHAHSGEVDVWLAARICEGYLWPNLELTDEDSGSRGRRLEMLETCRRVFYATTETNNVLTNYYYLQANAPNEHASDVYRVQLADWLEEKGALPQAHQVLSEIRDTNVLFGARERIARVKQRVVVR